MSEGHWVARAHQAFAAIAWWCALNAMWIAFTVAGGVVAGVGPATVTACIVCRRRMRGESIRLRDFAATWRAEFVRGNIVVLPSLLLSALLWWNYSYFSALGPAATLPRLITLAALVVAIAAGMYLAPIYAHYRVPLWSYPLHALRFARSRPASTIVLAFVFASLAFASAAMPVLLLTVSVGAWLQASTWLCVRFFQENEDRLADVGPPSPVRILPSEPLRIR